MAKHSAFFAHLIAVIFAVEGLAFLVSAFDAFQAGFRGGVLFSIFISFIHFFLAFGVFRRKKWAPHLGIFFEAYIVLNFVLHNRETLYSPILLPSAVTVLSASAFLAGSLFVLRNNFTE